MDPFDTYATAANVAAGMTAEQAATVTANTYGDQTMSTDTAEEAKVKIRELEGDLQRAQGLVVRWRTATDREIANHDQILARALKAERIAREACVELGRIQMALEDLQRAIHPALNNRTTTGPQEGN